MKEEKINISLKPKGVRRFRVHFGKEKSYYNVYIFKTRDEMTKWVETIRKAFQDKDFDVHFGALTHPWSVQAPDGTWTKDIGFITFCEPYLWNYVIAHELTHATIAWFERERPIKNLGKRDGVDNELFANELGEAMKQVLTKLGRDK